MLYFCYLFLVSYLSVTGLGVYSIMSTYEYIFWIFVLGYVANGIQCIISNGLIKYFQSFQAYFDTWLVFCFNIKYDPYNAVRQGPRCRDEIYSKCWVSSDINTLFTILWGSATIILWMKLFVFCLLSHTIGPMVQTIFGMFRDILTFFEIMLILYIGFSMCLAFLMKDADDDFASPQITALTLFRAILGDFDFEAFRENDTMANPALIYFGLGVMLIYVILGSLVFLNLLIAMMVKTYDSVQQDTIAAIIFTRFKMAVDYESSASFMPPPLNIIAIPCLASFYLIEGVINLFRYIVYKIGCASPNGTYYCYHHNGRNRLKKYDLAVELMPIWMKQRKLELDTQILYEYPKGIKHGDHIWEIMTSEGLTKCKIMEYKKETQEHYVEFYEYNDTFSELGAIITSRNGIQDDNMFKELKVSICNRIEKKHGWWVSLYDLRDEGLIDFKQFDDIKVDQQFTNIAHESMSEIGLEESAYWICAYCRGYVKSSDMSIKGLGRELKVRDLEMKLIL